MEIFPFSKPNNVSISTGKILIWEYRKGDSPQNKENKLLWLYEKSDSQQWKAVDDPLKIPLIEGQKNLWIKLRIISLPNNFNAIFLNRIEKILEVYLDTNKIYTYGDFSVKKEIPVMGFAWHLIKSSGGLNGKTVYFRFRSDTKYIGFLSKVQFGSEEFILNEIVKSNISKTILGIIFIVGGLFALIAFSFSGILKSFLGLIIFMITCGIWTLANSNLTQILIYAPRLIYYSDHLSLFASAIGFFMLVSEIVDSKYASIFKRIFQIIFIYFLTVVFLDITNLSENIDTVAPFLIIISTCLLILMYFILLSAKKGNIEAKLFLTALGIYAFFVIADIINYFQNVVIDIDTYNMQYAHYGGFVFLVFLTWMLVSRYFRMNRQLLQVQIDERQRIARDLHDEIGPRLTEIKIINENIKKNYSLPDKLQNELDELSSAANKVANTFGEIVWALNPANDTLEEFANYLSQNTINFLEKTEIKCRIELPPIFPAIPIHYDILRNIVLTVKEVLNNIVKHSSASVVNMTLNFDENILRLTIADNGKGFDKNNIRKYGNGLINIEGRIKNINGILTIDTQKENGTIIKIEVPIKK